MNRRLPVDVLCGFAGVTELHAHLSTIDTIDYIPGIGNASRAPINTIQIIFPTHVIMLK
jgi:hypothetical protein